MSAQPAEPTPAAPAAPATPAPPTPEAPPVPEADPSTLESAHALIQKLRDEVKSVKADRTPQDEKDAKVIASLKRQLEGMQSPEDVKKEMAQAIGLALGLVEDETIDPAKLTESLTASQADTKQAKVALAVYQNAGTAGGDPVALLDSTTFLKSVVGIEPTDSAAVAAAIKAAVEANPRLGAAPSTPPEPRTPAPNPAQGGSGSGVGPDLAAQIAEATAKGDWKTAIALETQKLATAPKP